MTIRSTVSAVSLGLLFSAALLGAASAQSRGQYGSFYGDPYSFPQVNVPFSSRDVGIAGPPRTCVKWCNQDSNPCDPPEYKRADARCNIFN